MAKATATTKKPAAKKPAKKSPKKVKSKKNVTANSSSDGEGQPPKGGGKGG